MNNVINQIVHFLISNKMENPSATRLAKAILSADFLCLIKYGRTITKQDSTYTLLFSEIQSAINNYKKEDNNYDELAEVDREELLFIMNRLDIDTFHDIPLKFNIELMESKDEQRKKYIEKHGVGCKTCDRNPVNHGKRATCHFDIGPHCVGYTEGDIICNEETGYPKYEVATSIYSIDIPYCC